MIRLAMKAKKHEELKTSLILRCYDLREIEFQELNKTMSNLE